MSVQEFAISINNYALGRTVNNPILRPVVIANFPGLASTYNGKLGTANNGNISGLGIGPGPDMVSLCLNSGLTSVDFYQAITGSSGAEIPLSGSFTNAGNLNATAVGVTAPVLSGVPLDNYTVRIEVLVNGTQANVQFRYSLDDGQSWIKTATFTGTAVVLYAAAAQSASPITSGLSVTFPTGSYVAGDVWSVACYPGSVYLAGNTTTTGSLEYAFANALANAPVKYTHAIIATEPGGTAVDATNITEAGAVALAASTGAGTLFSNAGVGLEVIMGTARKINLGTEDDTTFQALVTGSVSTLDSRLAIGYGHILRSSSTQKVKFWRSTAFNIVEELCRNNNPATSIYTARALSVVKPDTSVKFSKVDYTGLLQTGCTFDEATSTNSGGGTFGSVTPYGFIAPYRSHFSATPGTFSFLAGNTHSDPTGDFFEFVYAQQFNELESVISTAMYQSYKGQNLQTKTDGTGALSEAQCRAIESYIQLKVNQALVDPGYIPPAPPADGSSVTNFITVSRTQNVVSTGKLVWNFRMWAAAYVKVFQGIGSLTLG